MTRGVVFSEPVITTIDPDRVAKIADECLVEIRLIESRKEASAWVYEYEVKGESGRVEKFLVRIRKIEIGE